MSYHGLRDNGEGRPGDMNPHGSPSHATVAANSTTDALRSAGSSSSILISIPTPMRDMTPATHRIDPEITPDIPIRVPPPTPPHLRPILELLRARTPRAEEADRSRSPPRDVSAASSNSTYRRFQFYSGAAAGPALIEDLSGSMEAAIREALQVLPHHQVRNHIQAVLAQPPGNTTSQLGARSTISARLANFADSRDDAIEDS